MSSFVYVPIFDISNNNLVFWVTISHCSFNILMNFHSHHHQEKYWTGSTEKTLRGRVERRMYGEALSERTCKVWQLHWKVDDQGNLWMDTLWCLLECEVLHLLQKKSAVQCGSDTFKAWISMIKIKMNIPTSPDKYFHDKHPYNGQHKHKRKCSFFFLEELLNLFLFCRQNHLYGIYYIIQSTAKLCKTWHETNLAFSISTLHVSQVMD